MSTCGRVTTATLIYSYTIRPLKIFNPNSIKLWRLNFNLYNFYNLYNHNKTSSTKYC